MKRRDFTLCALSAAIAPSVHARQRAPAPDPPPIDALTNIKALRISTGPLTGGYLIAPSGRLNWYFANLGLISIVQYLSAADLDTYIRNYLDLYLSRLEANYTIKDVNFNFKDPTLQTFTLVASDSDDAYAATFLSLVARYLNASSNWPWWDANKARLKSIAYANIAMHIKTNGLCRVFQSSTTSTTASTGYLMDNCENYRGLRDFASILALRGESTDANYYGNFATGIGYGINIFLWDSGRSGFKVSDEQFSADTRTFYPGSTCQIFPQAYGVTEAAAYFALAYSFLNTCSPQWPSEVYDTYPWMILGYVAARRGDTTRATTQVKSTEKKFASDPSVVTINELGFYQRTKNLLNGLIDI